MITTTSPGVRPRAAAAALLATVALLVAACGPLPAPEDPSSSGTPWVQARGAVAATDAALDILAGDAVRGLIPEDDRDQYDTAIGAGRGVLELGGDLVDAWEAAGTTPQRWPWWLSKALEWAATVVGIVKDCGVEVPGAVSVAIGGLQLLLPVLAAIAGAS